MGNALILFICNLFLSIYVSSTERQKFVNSSDIPSIPYGSCESGVPVHCYCDELCFEIGDCCEEMYAKRKNSYFPDEKNLMWSCIDVGGFVYAITKCPSYSEKDLKLKCEENRVGDGLQYIIPVYSSERKLYRNKYCAYCNEEFKFEFANGQSARCTERIDSSFSQELILDLFKTGVCKPYFILPDNVRRTCYPELVSNCSNKSNNTDCLNSSTWYTFSDDKTYRNEACYECRTLLPKGDVPLQVPPRSNHMYAYDFLLNYQEWCGIECTDNSFNTSYFNETKNSKDTLSITERTYAVLTAISCIISAVSLILLIIVYACTPELRNFVGLLTICLSACIFVALTLFLLSRFATPSSTGCIFVSILMHYFYLASFHWMALFAIDLHNTFQSNSSSSKRIQKFVKFCFIGFALPAFLVFTTVVMDRAFPEFILSPAYGVKNCWFNKTYAGIVWFFIPVVLIITFNTVICVRMFHYFYQTARETERVRQHSRNHLLLICAKLTTLFGVTWILQILAAFTTSPDFNKMAGLINSLQGFFTAICFLATKRVRGLLSVRFRQYQASGYSQGRPTTRTTKLNSLTSSRNKTLK